MSDPSAISAPGRRRALLVTLAWGEPDAGFGGASFAEGGVARYTTWSDPIVISGQRFEPLEGDRAQEPRGNDPVGVDVIAAERARAPLDACDALNRHSVRSP